MTQQGTALARHFGRQPLAASMGGVTPRDAVAARSALAALAALAAASGVDVRIERFEHPLAGKGRLCRVEGTRVVFVDAKLGAIEQAGVIGEALAGLAISPRLVATELRAYLNTGHAEVKALLRPRPLVRVK